MQNLKKGFLTRGIAWLLAFVMVLTIVPFRAFAEDELEVSPPEAPSQVRDAAAPEDTSTSADAKNAVHGFVGVLVGGDINADLAKETGQRFKPIEGVKVYFQWYEAKEIELHQPTMQFQEPTDSFILKLSPTSAEIEN